MRYLWDETLMPADPVDQLVYRSNLLGRDRSTTNYGGGNTSVKAPGVDPVTLNPIEVLWIKGSGSDLATLQRSELVPLNNDLVLGLERGYRGVSHEDHQARLLACCVANGAGGAPSIDTPLHALIPYAHVDHVHPDALIAFATAVEGRRLVEEVYGNEVGWLDWQRPGYGLAIKLRDLVKSRPGLRAVVLGGHGLVAWANTSKECYDLTLTLIDRAMAAIDERSAGRSSPIFGNRTVVDLAPTERRRQAALAMPLFRQFASSQQRMIGTYRDDDAILDFIGSHEAPRLVQQGTSCPDHFLRTKQRPLLLSVPPDVDPMAVSEDIAAEFDAYREDYARYYHASCDGNSSAMRSPNPVVILWPGIGMFTMARSSPEARIAGEFYLNAVNVMRGAETLSAYQGLDEGEAFGIEYWALEEAKLKRMLPEKSLSRRVALVTGAAGGIGTAIVRRFVAEGASVVIADIDADGVMALAQEFGEQAVGICLDVTDEAAVDAAFKRASLAFGGVDLLVNNAGISISKSLVDTSATEFDTLQAVINRGSFLVSQAFVRHAIVQGLGGDIIYIVSKNAIVAGPNNIAYGTAKGAQLHQMRLLAAEVAEQNIRVNAVNPDAVIEGSKIFAGAWGDERAATYGVSRDRLGEFYAQRTLLKREILPQDVAAACFVLVGGNLEKTTGMVIPVDGGVASAFLR